MRRRDLFTGVFGAVCAATTTSGIAQTVRRRRLAYLSGGKKGTSYYTIDVLRASLRDLGWRENETLEIDARWADGDPSRLASPARNLFQLRPDVIATTGDSETKALQLATQDIPIVFHLVGDPVASGLVASISHPGGNTTGLSQGPQILWSKRLGLFTEMLGRQPHHLAWLGNPGNLGSELNWTDAKDAATRVAADLVRINLGEAEGLEMAFKNARGLDGLLVQWDFLFSILANQIAQRAAQERVPAIYENRAQVVAGGLMSYGSDVREAFRQGAAYVDRIFKGTRPADLPVIQASLFELVINKGAATALGLVIPNSLLVRADEIIE